MGELWNGLTAFWKEADGAYISLFAAALIFCALEGVLSGALSKSDKSARGAAGTGFRIAVCALVWSVLWMNPVTAMLVQRACGIRYGYERAFLLLPALPLIAYAAAEIAGRAEAAMPPVKTAGRAGAAVPPVKTAGRAGAAMPPAVRTAAAVCIVALALVLAGRVYPYDSRAELEKWGATGFGPESAEITQILEQAEQMERDGQIPLLVAPKEIMECIRRYGAGIVLAYGRNLWQTDALTCVNDRYTDEQIVLCQSMESEELPAREKAELACEYGCNLIVLKEPLGQGFLQEWKLKEVCGEENFYFYIR